MLQAQPPDVRKRMVKAVDAGSSRNAVAKRFDVAPSTVVKLMRHVKTTGCVAPRTIGGYRKHKLAAQGAVVRALLQSRNTHSDAHNAIMLWTIRGNVAAGNSTKHAYVLAASAI
jgi:transposase